MSPENPTPKFCWRCGNRVKSKMDRCWYCNAVVNRTIRPPAYCPFCGEAVNPEAKKCPHCHEWLDGREKSAESRQQAPNITFMIDKAVINGNEPVKLVGGQAVPQNVARVLSDQTRQAIESGQPALIDQDGIKALPQPGSAGDEEEEEVIDAEVVPAQLPDKSGKKSSGAIVRSEGAAPARADQGTSPAKAEKGLLSKLSDRFLEAFEPEAEPPIEDLEAKPKSKEEELPKYRNCPACGTEVLGSDYYCFQCGTILRERPKQKRGGKRRVDLGPPPLGLYFMNAIFFAAILYFGLFGDRHIDAAESGYGLLEMIVLMLAGISLIIALTSIMRRRNLKNFFLGLIFLALWALVSLIAAFGTGIL
ncbi:MAG: hypothetical protein ACLFUS_13480 [Candidatus Sumerlaeia bacterium]